MKNAILVKTSREDSKKTSKLINVLGSAVLASAAALTPGCVDGYGYDYCAPPVYPSYSQPVLVNPYGCPRSPGIIIVSPPPRHYSHPYGHRQGFRR